MELSVLRSNSELATHVDFEKLIDCRNRAVYCDSSSLLIMMVVRWAKHFILTLFSELAAMEMRKSIELEKERALWRLRKQLEHKFKKIIEETKKKQWVGYTVSLLEVL